MDRRSQQDWVKDLMLHIILTLRGYNDGDMFSTGYGYSINGAIDNYTLIYYDEKKGKNIGLYQNYYKNYCNGNYKNVLLSKKAFELLSNAEKTNCKIENEKKVFHGEHMTPMSYTRRFLNDLLDQKDVLSVEELKEKVDFAFTHAKFVIITKEEQQILDGKNKRYTKQEIEEFLEKFRTIKKVLSNETEEAYIALENYPKKSYGFGAIRLFSMLSNGVIFVDSTGKEKTFEECISYLENTDFVV